MIRSSRGDAAKRAFGLFARATIEKIDDTKKRQELDLNLLQDETKTGVEKFSNYGFKSVPLKPSQGQGGAKQYATAIVAFLSGNRSHGVVIATSDKRYEPNNWKEGESGLHDHQGQVVHVTNGGINIRGGTKQGDDEKSDKKLPITMQVGDQKFVVTKDDMTKTVGNASIKIENGRITATVGNLFVQITASRIDLGGVGGSAVMTTAGPSSKVFAVV